MRKIAETVTHRGESTVPAKLSQFIRLVNADFGPQHTRIPDWRRELINAEVQSGRPRYKLWDQLYPHWQQVCRVFAERLSKETRDFLGSPDEVLQFSQNYELLTTAGRVLRAIAYRNTATSDTPQIKTAREEFRTGVPDSEVSLLLVVDGSGRFAVSENPFLDAMISVPADRIRACAVCQQIFWAKRINSECCQESCRKVFNQRNVRKKRLAQMARKRKVDKKGR